jgi:hypothetical protein
MFATYHVGHVRKVDYWFLKDTRSSKSEHLRDYEARSPHRVKRVRQGTARRCAGLLNLQGGPMNPVDELLGQLQDQRLADADNTPPRNPHDDEDYEDEERNRQSCANRTKTTPS